MNIFVDIRFEIAAQGSIGSSCTVRCAASALAASAAMDSAPSLGGDKARKSPAPNACWHGYFRSGTLQIICSSTYPLYRSKFESSQWEPLFQIRSVEAAQHTHRVTDTSSSQHPNNSASELCISQITGAPRARWHFVPGHAGVRSRRSDD